MSQLLVLLLVILLMRSLLMVEVLISIKYLDHLAIAQKLSSLITFIVDLHLALMDVGSHSHMQGHRIFNIVIIVNKDKHS